MPHEITEITSFDNKRNKVTLDYGEVTFLLYKGECRKAGIDTDRQSGGTLSDGQYEAIINDILLPRAKKRVLYYLKNADKTKEQIRRKLTEGLYPDEVIEQTLAFLDKYGFADDERYAEQYIEELKGRYSAREIALKLRQKGISKDCISDKLGGLTAEDEQEACSRCLSRKYPAGVSEEDRQKAYAFLARKGFGFDVTERVLRIAAEDIR